MTPTPLTSTGQLANLVNGWAAHFWAADHDLTWLRSEVEAHLWLESNTLLLGRVDAFGRDANGQLFFGEWKTSSPRDKKTWKQTWRLNPQSLTYGVLAETVYPGTRRFMVRKAFKTEPPSYDHQWYSYTEPELEFWRSQLKAIASDIRRLSTPFSQGNPPAPALPWPVNLSSCHQFGLNYACPFFEPACSRLDWAGKPANALVRISHLDMERRLNESIPADTVHADGVDRQPAQPGLGGDALVKGGAPADLVVLDATRVKTWLSCRERFRREYIENVAVPLEEGSALDVGINFHELLATYYQGLVSKEVTP